jgi:asparagine synthase (glutamine-hydrolysing)
MSGVCAIATFDGTPVTGAVVETMMAAAAHRGRDGQRVWTAEGAALAHQRRVVTPEDPADRQPLVRDGLVVVADARLDNRGELLSLLSRHGFLPDASPPTDAELVLGAYRLWDRSCPAHLLGDFAFIVWDQRDRSLFAARDPMGMRALYLRDEPRRRVVLATELKQILAVPDVPRRPFEPAMVATLAGPYLPSSWTHYDGIAQLPPGSAIHVTSRGATRSRYWNPDPGACRSHTSPQEAAEAFRAALDTAVAARMRTEGPLGVFLSGGMDSGHVASAAGRLLEQGRVPSTGRIRSYSWAFTELAGCDERDVSDEIVRRYGLEPTGVPADDAWPLADYPEVAPDEDDPYTWVYQDLVERAVTQAGADGVRLLLGGDRGDELTGDWVFDELGLLRRGRFREAATDLRHATHESALPPATTLRRHVLRPLVEARWPTVTRAVRDRRGGHRLWPPWIPDRVAAEVGLGDLIAEATTPPPFDGAARRLRWGRIFSPQGARIAVMNERTRARHGIAYADPYSDRRLVELVLALPPSVVQRRSRPKGLARAAAVGVMPEAALRASRKVTPMGLFDRGFRDRGAGRVDGLLTDTRAAAGGWLDESPVRAEYARYRDRGDGEWDFWWPVTVEMWLRRWWDRP